jgi:hypothetical protein
MVASHRRTPVKAMSKQYAVFWVSAFLAIPLWREFYEPDQMIWNVFLTTFLISLVAAIYLGLRYLEQNQITVGEAEFTRAQRDTDGS